MGLARATVRRVNLFESGSDVKDENSGLQGSMYPGLCLITGLLVCAVNEDYVAHLSS